MTAIETLERAISRIEQLRDEATPGEWWATRDLKWPSVFAGTGLNNDVMVTSDCRLPGDAALIVALSRTVEPMLDTLRLSRGMAGAQIQGEQAAATIDLALHLARAILGEEAESE